jgi:hypothetical protein
VAPELNPAKIVKDLQERADFVLNADTHLAEIVRLLKNTNETLENLNKVVGRLIGMLDEVERRTGPITNVLGRLDRLEEAAFNIERATLGVESAMLALPRALRSRIQSRGKPTQET